MADPMSGPLQPEPSEGSERRRGQMWENMFGRIEKFFLPFFGSAQVCPVQAPPEPPRTPSGSATSATSPPAVTGSTPRHGDACTACPRLRDRRVAHRACEAVAAELAYGRDLLQPAPSKDCSWFLPPTHDQAYLPSSTARPASPSSRGRNVSTMTASSSKYSAPTEFS